MKILLKWAMFSILGAAAVAQTVEPGSGANRPSGSAPQAVTAADIQALRDALAAQQQQIQQLQRALAQRDQAAQATPQAAPQATVESNAAPQSTAAPPPSVA